MHVQEEMGYVPSVPAFFGLVLEPEQMAMEQLSQLRRSGRRMGEHQSVAQGGDEGSGCSVARISGIDSLRPHPLHKPQRVGPPASHFAHRDCDAHH
jgi:hypothetical protein